MEPLLPWGLVRFVEMAKLSGDAEALNMDAAQVTSKIIAAMQSAAAGS